MHEPKHHRGKSSQCSADPNLAEKRYQACRRKREELRARFEHGILYFTFERHGKNLLVVYIDLALFLDTASYREDGRSLISVTHNK
jgi:hypothetical protein